jgi:hypothetical protein
MGVDFLLLVLFMGLSLPSKIFKKINPKENVVLKDSE